MYQRKYYKTKSQKKVGKWKLNNKNEWMNVMNELLWTEILSGQNLYLYYYVF